MKRSALQVGISSVLGLSLTVVLVWMLGYQSVIKAAGFTVCPAGPPTCDYSTIQEAVDAAGNGDTIKVAAGTYTDIHQAMAPQHYGASGYSGVVTHVLYISKSVTIQGGYTTAFSEPPAPDINLTTLDAQGQGRVILVSGDISTTISGLRITGGDATGLGGYLENIIENPSDAGGGIYVAVTTATLRQNQIFGNTAGGGGGVYVGWGNGMVIEQNTMTNNNADYGGGLYLDFSDATVRDNTISSNTASGSSGSDGGGGVYLFVSNPTFSRNTVTGNSTPFSGGGLYLWESDGSFSENIITENTANDDGGGLYVYLSNAALTNNLIAGNQIGSNGSGVHIQSSILQLKHNTIAGNTGGDGSGVYVNGSQATLTNNILVDHTIGITAAARIGGQPSATLEATLWGSGSWANGTDWAGAGKITTGTINIWGDPAFVAPGTGNYHLGPGSAAPDAGVNAGIGTDIDGEPRPMGLGFDIGFDEMYQATPSLSIIQQVNLATVQSGQPLTYTIWITNTGNVTLTASITDILPDHVTPGGIRTWAATIPAPEGMWTQEVVVAVEMDYSGPLTNVVQVTTVEGAGGIDTNILTPAQPVYLPIVLKEG